jgi:hypothetical protein
MVVCSFPFIFMPCWVCDVPVFIPLFNSSVIRPLPSADAAAEAALEAVAEAAWWQQMLYYSPLVALFQIGWAAVQIAHLSLIPDLTANERGRTELTAVRLVFKILP